jgi:hypothetical protein
MQKYQKELLVVFFVSLAILSIVLYISSGGGGSNESGEVVTEIVSNDTVLKEVSNLEILPKVIASTVIAGGIATANTGDVTIPQENFMAAEELEKLVSSLQKNNEEENLVKDEVKILVNEEETLVKDEVKILLKEEETLVKDEVKILVNEEETLVINGIKIPIIVNEET